MFVPGQTPCQKCGKNVYPMEMLVFNQLHFHKWCFRCHKCNAALSILRCTVDNGELYCSRHFTHGYSCSTATSESHSNTQQKKTLKVCELPDEVDLNDNEVDLNDNEADYEDTEHIDIAKDKHIISNKDSDNNINTEISQETAKNINPENVAEKKSEQTPTLIDSHDIRVENTEESKNNKQLASSSSDMMETISTSDMMKTIGSVKNFTDTENVDKQAVSGNKSNGSGNEEDDDYLFNNDTSGSHSVMDDLLKKCLQQEEEWEHTQARLEREIAHLQSVSHDLGARLEKVDQEKNTFEKLYYKAQEKLKKHNLLDTESEEEKEEETDKNKENAIEDVEVENSDSGLNRISKGPGSEMSDSIRTRSQSFVSVHKNNTKINVENLVPETIMIEAEEGWSFLTGNSVYSGENFSFVSSLTSKSSFYKTHFYGQQHTNYFAIDKCLGKLLISIRKESVKSKTNSEKGYQYRCIIRCEENEDEVITIPESWVRSHKRDRRKPHRNSSISVKEVINFAFPRLQLITKMKTVSLEKLEDVQESMLQFDEEHMLTHYKFGIVYAKEDQRDENEFFGNEHGSEAFDRFLEVLGDTITLKGFDFFRGGLDVKENTTGEQSVFTLWQNYEIMFHVSTMLPYMPTNKQQLGRKAHIGNDIVVIVFQESNTPFLCSSLVAQFPHVFIVVNPIDNDRYRVSVSKRDGVPEFAPQEWDVFEHDGQFRDFLLTTLINGEHASYKSPKFKKMRQRTRKLLLSTLFETYLPDLKVEGQS